MSFDQKVKIRSLSGIFHQVLGEIPHERSTHVSEWLPLFFSTDDAQNRATTVFPFQIGEPARVASGTISLYITIYQVEFIGHPSTFPRQFDVLYFFQALVRM